MTLSQVDVITPQGTTLELPLQDYSEGYLVEDVEGLDPVPAVLVSSSFANVDGEQHHSSRRDKRIMVLHLSLEPSQFAGTGRQLRKNLYNYLMPTATVKLRLYDDDIDTGFVDIVGVVETFDCPLFVQEIKATISLTCFESEFISPDPIVIEGGTTNGLDELEIDYKGTIETGMLFTMTTDRIVEEFTIHHRSSDNTTSTLEFEETLGTGDSIQISTVTGAKRATLTVSEGGSSSILYGIPGYSNWINLFPGKNYIRVHVDDESEVPIPFTIQYTTKYGGL